MTTPTPGETFVQALDEYTKARTALDFAQFYPDQAPSLDGWVQTTRQCLVAAYDAAVVTKEPGISDNRHPYWPLAVKQAERAYAALAALLQQEAAPAVMSPSTPPAGGREALCKTLMRIARNDGAPSWSERFALGQAIGIISALAAQPEPAARDIEDAERLSASTLTRAIQSIKGSTYNLTKDECIFVLENLRDDAARAATKPQGGA